MFKAIQSTRPLIALMTVAALSLSVAAPSSAKASDGEITTLLVVPAEGGAPILMGAKPEKPVKMRPAQKRSTTHRIRVGEAKPVMSPGTIRAQAASRVDPDQPNRPRMAWPYTARTIHYQ